MDFTELLGQYLYGRVMIPGRILTANEAGIIMFLLQLYGFKPQVVYAYPRGDPVFAEIMVAITPGELERMYCACMAHGFSFVQVNSSLVVTGANNGSDKQDGDSS